MKKIDFNIAWPEDRVFNEFLFKQEYPELYEKYLTPPTKDTIMNLVEETISNMLTRALNKVEFDKKDFREKPTTSSDMPAHTNFARVINAIRGAKDNWVKMEDADFEFLKKNWNEAKCPIFKNSALQLKVINDAIETAASKKGNPDG